MLPSCRTPLGPIRLAGFAEAVSFLVLTGVAMPIKYIGHDPLPVRICGMAHGLLFTLLCVLVFRAFSDGRLKTKTAGLVLFASLLPFGPFFMERRLRREDGPARA